MEAPPSTPDPQTQRRVISAGGTIVGMPAIIPNKSQRDAAKYFEQLKSTTLRSVYSVQSSELALTDDGPTSEVESAPCSDAFHPERWSVPPPSGLEPIYPCEEPEEEADVQLMPALEPRARLAAFAERNADSAVAEADAESASAAEPSAPVTPSGITKRVISEAPSSPWSAPAEAAVEPPRYVEEWAYIPMRRSTEDRRLLLIAAVASGSVVVAALSALTVLL